MIKLNSLSLRQLGFIPEQVVEVILTTMSSHDEPNAAPMGLWVKPGLQLLIRPYADSQTARNLIEVPEAVINITHDTRIFFQTAFKKELNVDDAEWFEPSQTVKVARLRDMMGYIEINVKPSPGSHSGQNSTEYICNVLHVDVPTKLPQVYSRAQFATIEAIIHATRIQALSDVDSIATEKLLTQIQKYHTLVHRIAPHSVHAEVIDEVLQLVDRWVHWL